MRKLIVQQWVTVHNIAAEEDGGLSFVPGEPFDDAVTTNPFQNNLMGFIDSVDTMILGANTYAQTKDYWPNAADQGEYGRKLNNFAKFVASSTSSGCWSARRRVARERRSSRGPMTLRSSRPRGSTTAWRCCATKSGTRRG
jgi:hypothetical protein